MQTTHISQIGLIFFIAISLIFCASKNAIAQNTETQNIKEQTDNKQDSIDAVAQYQILCDKMIELAPKMRNGDMDAIREYQKFAEEFTDSMQNNADIWNNLSAEDAAKIQEIAQKTAEAMQNTQSEEEHADNKQQTVDIVAQYQALCDKLIELAPKVKSGDMDAIQEYQKVAEDLADFAQNYADAWNNLSEEDAAKIRKIEQKVTEAMQNTQSEEEHTENKQQTVDIVAQYQAFCDKLIELAPKIKSGDMDAIQEYQKVAEDLSDFAQNNADAWNNLSAEDTAKIQEIGQKTTEAMQKIFDSE